MTFTVDAKQFPFDSMVANTVSYIGIKFIDGITRATAFKVGFIDYDMANNGSTPSVMIFWKDANGDDVIGFNGSLSLGNSAEVRDPATHELQFLLIPIRVDSVDTDSSPQNVSILIAEITDDQ